MKNSNTRIITDNKGESKVVWESTKVPTAVKNLAKIELAKTDEDLEKSNEKDSKEVWERIFGKNYKLRQIDGSLDDYGLPKIILENDDFPNAVKNLQKIKENKDGKN